MRAARPLLSLPILALAALLASPAPARPTDVASTFDAPLEPASTGGVELIDRLLAKLATHRRLLVIGAHPDDEDTTLLTLVARGMGGEAAYFSLSRGDGGQNLIGPELGVGLGLIRSRELLAARRTDGARQFFSRAYDFGYTRSIDETLRLWPREVLLEDAVRVIRRFQPQVVVAVFPADERAGHGQHQASGLIADEALALAGDPEAFPGLGPAPWRPQAFYRMGWWDPDSATLTVPLSALDPVAGRSVFQIAMASRSKHRSQDMGMLEPLGPRETRLIWVDGGGGSGSSGGGGEDPFAGIDTGLGAIAAGLPAGAAHDEVVRRLTRAGELATAARADLSAAHPEATLPAARRILAEIAAAGTALDGAADPAGARAAAAALVDEKRAVAERLVAAVAGLAVDAWADRELLVAGEDFVVETALWNASGLPGAELVGVELASPDGTGFAAQPATIPEREGWEARLWGTDEPEAGFYLRDFRVTTSATAAPTVPYFLVRPLDGALYDWSTAPAEVRGEPFGPPPLVARFRVRLPAADGAAAPLELTVEREVVFRTRDQAVGEVRRPLRVVPALEVAPGRDLIVWPVAETEPRTVEVALTSHAAAPLSGRLGARVPPGWPPVEPVPFTLEGPGERQPVRLTLAPPAGLAPGRYAIQVEATVDGGPGGAAAGARYELAVPAVDYPHIRPTPWPKEAVVEVSATDLVLPPLERVGYVRGASDRVPELLAEVGVPIELLDARRLDTADLSVYDAIVVGSRAYETEPALAEANRRLLDYARAGGLLIVQYQQYPFVDGGFAPFPLSIARPHDRVTDETAPVRPLDPDHPALTTPNRIGAADWEGWVQERGLYFAHDWDPAYRPLLAMADPGGPELEGGLLVAPLGEGTYVYTGLAFFRQLPAGVPGAYRLFANLLALR